ATLEPGRPPDRRRSDRGVWLGVSLVAHAGAGDEVHRHPAGVAHHVVDHAGNVAVLHLDAVASGAVDQAAAHLDVRGVQRVDTGLARSARSGDAAGLERDIGAVRDVERARLRLLDHDAHEVDLVDVADADAVAGVAGTVELHVRERDVADLSAV